MNPLNILSQFPAGPVFSAAPGRPDRGGQTPTDSRSRTDGFGDFLTALAAGEAEAPGAARNLARLKAAGLRNEMLANLINLDGGGETRAAGLVERANLEALLSSGRFGNLLGWSGISGPEIGRVMNVRDLNSWRQKNGPLGLGRPPAEAGMEGLPPAPSQAYLVRPPQRKRLAENRETPPEQPPAAVNQPASASPSPPPSAPPPAPSSAQPPAGLTAEGAHDKFTSEQLDKLVHKVALALNMDPHLIKAVIKAESNFDPQAVSRVGAKGLMQLMPGTAKELGVKDPFNPVENVWAGARYLKKMLDRHSGNINNALASYNWGPGNFDRHGSQRLPGETKRYISVVNKHYAKLKQSGAVSA